MAVLTLLLDRPANYMEVSKFQVVGTTKRLNQLIKNGVCDYASKDSPHDKTKKRSIENVVAVCEISTSHHF